MIIFKRTNANLFFIFLLQPKNTLMFQEQSSQNLCGYLNFVTFQNGKSNLNLIVLRVYHFEDYIFYKDLFQFNFYHKMSLLCVILHCEVFYADK